MVPRKMPNLGAKQSAGDSAGDLSNSQKPALKETLFVGFTDANLKEMGLVKAQLNERGEVIPSSLSFENGRPLNEPEREAAISQLKKGRTYIEGIKPAPPIKEEPLVSSGQEMEDSAAQPEQASVDAIIDAELSASGLQEPVAASILSKSRRRGRPGKKQRYQQHNHPMAHFPIESSFLPTSPAKSMNINLALSLPPDEQEIICAVYGYKLEKGRFVYLSGTGGKSVAQVAKEKKIAPEEIEAIISKISG